MQMPRLRVRISRSALAGATASTSTSLSFFSTHSSSNYSLQTASSASTSDSLSPPFPPPPPAPSAQSAQPTRPLSTANDQQQVGEKRSSTAEPAPRRDVNSFDGRIEGQELKKDRDKQDGVHEEPPKKRVEERSQPRMDEINTLLRHPTLYDPVLVPRNPIVLCHGLYGFDVRGPAFFRLHYWGDLLKILRGKVGAEVFVTSVPGTGAVRERARVMHEGLQQIPELLGRDLNFIAHSMGGLDARYLISNIRPTTYNPRSLTTLSTPHRGSEFMAWCRANIGIGTDFDKNSEEAAATAHRLDDTSIPLPFSLKSPILTREAAASVAREAKAEKDAKDAADEVKRNNLFGRLPFSLSSSVSGYLLDLLDSPAYANLTPSFLRDVFNPGTPDVPGVRYFSVAARTEKIGIWHPLWLPKVVLDGAERARQENGIVVDPKWRGNDGLVNVESAKWGEFLGILEGCDHWEVRGSSGLIDAVASAKAVAEVTKLTSTKAELQDAEAKAKKNGGGRGWSWQDLYALVGSSNKSNSEKSKSAAIAATSAAKPKERDEGKAKAKSDEEGGLNAIASWIVGILPGGPTSASNNSSSSSSSSNGNSNTHSHAQPHPDGGSFTSSATPRLSTQPLNGAGSHQSARMLYGVSASSKPEKFDLERLSLALCRKLHNEGL